MHWVQVTEGGNVRHVNLDQVMYLAPWGPQTTIHFIGGDKKMSVSETVDEILGQRPRVPPTR